MYFSERQSYPDADRKEVKRTLDQKKTGQFLKALRNEKNLTQEQLAKQFNVSNRSVSRWETGSNLPDISLLVEIADFYDVDVREIIDGERKSEMMDKETREVAEKMATYAGNEKDRTLRGVQIAGIAGVMITLTAIIMQIKGYDVYNPNVHRSLGIFLTFLAFAAMSFLTLYVTGILKKISKHRKIVILIRVLTIILLVAVTHCVLGGFLVVGLFAVSFYSAKVKVTNDTADYNTYIHSREIDTEYMMGKQPIFDIFPETLNAPVDEFQITYYNPWDPQYIVYMTLDYGEKYDEEIARLQAIGIDDYKGIYTVTGEPEGYDLVAMDSDEYNGFVYAMIPEGQEGNTKITDCAIVFCNYFLDLDVHEYIPDKYLLPGFDATDENPYRKEKLNL